MQCRQPRMDKPAWLSFSASPIYDGDGSQVGVVATFTDITDLRSLQSSMEDHIHMLAHDLRTPLTIISGHAELLRLMFRHTETWEKVQFNTESIINATGQLKQMMEELVEIGRLESGQVTLHQDLVCLPDFLEDFLRHRRSIASEYRRVRLHLSRDLPAVRIGRRHLERFLENLVGNALKYSPAVQPVEIAAVCENGQICLCVRDYGQGIDPEDLSNVFKRFYRTSSAKRKTSGTGMGLYITKSLIECYGGSIRAESEAGKGSRFFLCLPRA